MDQRQHALGLQLNVIRGLHTSFGGFTSSWDWAAGAPFAVIHNRLIPDQFAHSIPALTYNAPISRFIRVEVSTCRTRWLASTSRLRSPRYLQLRAFISGSS